ncbi:neprilysin-2-like [Dermacentor variabilis]|uniref:neprilysin-2-like n=1 Tax=Dermacentor variabilis TaxID=34621 RepID=UPI003F5B49B0
MSQEARNEQRGATRITVPPPAYPRARTGSLSTLPAFAVVLLSTAGCTVVLGALVCFYTAYSGSTLATVGARGIGNGDRPIFDVSSLKDTVCRSQFCEWNKDYILDVVDDTKDPCDDFYAHVCNPRRWLDASNRSTSSPFSEFSAAQLMADIERFFRHFVELRGKPIGDNFLVRMMWVYDACKRDSGANGNASSELADILSALGLSGATGFESVIAGTIARVTAIGDRHLRLHPLFKVHVRHAGTLNSTAGYDVILSAPHTHYRRFLTNFPGSTDSQYVDLVTRALILYSATTSSAMARKVMLLEKQLERMMLTSEEQPMRPPREEYSPLKDLFLSDRWDWSVYFNTLFNTSGGGIGNKTKVFVNDPTFFWGLGTVLNVAWEPVIVNYMIFKAIVELSPVLGRETEYLIRLTHDYEAQNTAERQAACFGLLEKLFKYGTGIVAKLTLGKEFATTPRFHMDRQLSSLFGASRRLIADLVNSGRSWISAADKATALGKLRAVHFEFGAQCNLVEYELYRRASEAKYDVHAPQSVAQIVETGGTLPRWNHYSLPRVVFNLYSLAANRYWDAWRSNASRGYDNRYTLTVFRPGYELQRPSNVLVLSHATAAFLTHLSNVIEPVVYGVVAVHLVRGLLEALTFSGSSLDAHFLSRPWWSIATFNAYENVSTCLRSEYQPFLAEGIRLRTLEMNFIDNAILYPLFRLYRNEETIRGYVNLTDRFEKRESEETAEMDQMFFYNYAIALCDLSDEQLGQQQNLFHRTPAPWRVNVPLRNFPEFAEAFKCKRSSRMNPERRCTVWKEELEVQVK